ncbi:MAG: hypothetical protein J2P31_08385, partial [Blastocatellia bacterium]|nr:hypothetical protein [Blastocatellia bacterium]
KDRGTIPKEIRVWLLSDLLLRDERLRPSASITHFAAALGDQLGVTLMLRQTPKSGGQDKGPRKMDFAARPRRTDSWNTAWVLPRPSLVGLSAGSSFVFKVTDTKINAAEFSRRLKEVEANGLGERRAEGYGQMCFDDLLLSEELRGCTGSPDTANDRPEFKPVKDGSDEYRYAHLIEVEGWRKEIRRRALDKASTEEGREEAMGIKFDGHRSKPRMSQLGALRSVLMQLRDYQDADKVTAWIERVKESENRKKEWECSLKSIEKLVTDHQCVWKLLGESQDTWSDFTITSGGEKLLLNELWAEAVRTLVDACVRAQKRELEKLQKQNGNGSGKKGA